MRFLEKWRTRGRAERSQHVYVSERYGVRSLHIGSDTVQSSMRLARPNDLELSYTRSMMAFRLFVPAPREVLLIGLGGGSLAKFVYHRLTSTRIQVVEINPQVVAIARRSFFVPPDEPRLQVITADGAVHVQRNEVHADVIAIDGYESDVLVEELASHAFYANCRSSLHPAGVATINLWGGSKLFHTLLQRIKDAFPGILCLPAERPGNVVVFGFERKPPPFAWAALAHNAAILEAEDGLEYSRFVEALKKMNPHNGEFLYT